MKTSLSLLNVIILFSLLMISTSCHKTQETTQNWYLTGTDSAKIVDEVLAATNAFAKASINMDADEEIRFWDSSPLMMFAENGMQFANRDSIFTSMKGWYSKSDSVNFIWEERNILPITKRVADLFGSFYFQAKLKSGGVVKVRAYDTWLLVKEVDGWKILRGHESYKIVE